MVDASSNRNWTNKVNVHKNKILDKIFNFFIKKIGSQSVDTLTSISGITLLIFKIFRDILRPPFYFSNFINQTYSIGVKSFLLAAITGLATGSVMALQFGHGLAKFGGTLYIPKVVSLSILREMGPVFTSLLIAGRVGSGIASEIASMNVTQQIDAMRALGTNPIKVIVIPRVLACMVTLPLLTLFADYIGIFGAMIVSNYELHISSEYFIAKATEAIRIVDLLTGMAKSLFFAFFISIIACWKGLNTTGGTKGIGNTTTWVVVTSCIFILISDYFLSKVFIFTVYQK